MASWTVVSGLAFSVANRTGARLKVVLGLEGRRALRRGEREVLSGTSRVAR